MGTKNNGSKRHVNERVAINESPCLLCSKYWELDFADWDIELPVWDDKLPDWEIDFLNWDNLPT
jgi:hypothetical protein